jgi:hypothetical protein
VSLIEYLTDYPALAALPGLVFLGLYRFARRRSVLGAALAWLLYGLYEYGIKSQILCSGECNIRIDLLVIYPVLLLVSIIGVLAAATTLRGNPATRIQGTVILFGGGGLLILLFIEFIVAMRST